MKENNGIEKIEYGLMGHPYGEEYNPKKWKDALDFTREYLRRINRNATIRFIYYRIIEEAGIDLPLTKNVYESFLKMMTRARKDYTNKENYILIQNIIDDTRNRNVERFFDWTKTDEDSFMEDIERSLTEMRRTYPYDKYMELWFEDDGMWQMYRELAEKYRISTECIGGNLIINSVYGSYHRIIEKANGKDVIILYVGDYNPSGNRRPFNIKSAFKHLGINCDMYKIMVTKSQIKKYNILPDIDAPKTQERIKKAKRDPLIKWFVDNYGIDVYDVNAQAIDIPITERIIEDAIKQFVDISKLDNLDEERPIKHEIEWDGDGYKIKMDRLKEVNP